MRVNFTIGMLMCFAAAGLAADYDSASTVPTNKSVSELAASAKAQPAGVRNVIIVYKTHFDIGYSERVQQVIHDYRTAMADRVLEAIGKNSQQPKEKQFVWTLSGWPMKQILWAGQTKERREKIEQAMRDRNLAIHAYPFTTHTETAEPEDLVRGLAISSALARSYGLPLSASAKMSDVPGQSWIFPTLFAHAGITFYHMGGPVVNRQLGLPPFFWWEGPDGSRLLTLYNNGYGSAQLPPEGWPYKAWIYISMTGDNQGPPDAGTVSRDIAFYAGRGIHAKVGTMDDFAELIMKEDLSKLPVVRSDIGDPWIHGAMSQPEASRLAQNIRPSIGGMDQLATLLKGWGAFVPDLRATVADAYEQSLLYSEHTWGLANQHYLKVPYGKAWEELWEQGLPAQFTLMEVSFKDHAEYVENVQKLVERPYADAVSSLADNLNVSGNRMVVYNPLPWARDGEVAVDTRLVFGNGFASLKPADGGPALAVSHEYPAIEDGAPMSRFVAKDIPPLGYRAYVASDEKVAGPELSADAATGVIESPFFKATMDARRGRIASLIDKRSGRELVDAEAPQGFGQYFYERFGYKEISDWINASLYPEYQAHKMIFAAYDMPQDVPYASALPENMTLAVEKSAVDVTAVMTGTLQGPGLPQRLSIRLRLPGAIPAADIEVTWQKQPDTWPEAAWICLPFTCAHPKFRLGRVGADLDPVKDMTVDNANYHLFWVNTGVSVYDGETGAGVSLCPQDSPLVSLGEPGEYRFDKRYEPKKPYVYLNLYNNHWRTNFAPWIGDGRRMSARVRLWTFETFASESSLYTPAMEARVPLQVSVSKVKPGKLPPTRAGITLSRKGVAVTAFGPNPDGAGTVLRVWEQGGVSGELTVTLPGGWETAKVTPVDLRGRPVGPPIQVKDGGLKVEVKAYAPRSFVIE